MVSSISCVCFVGLELFLLMTYVSALDKGYFWQITDLHFDPEYSVNGTLGKLCHKQRFQPANDETPGKFGDPKCDTPWTLVQSAIEAMKSIHANPDFVLWTGDTGPHSDTSQKELNGLVKETTDLLSKTFNASNIIPVLGNHDVLPSGQMPVDNSAYYKSILKDWGWETLLSADEQKTFLKGGYYSRMMTPEFTLVVLNTNLHFVYDKVTIDMIDPAGMFGWLRHFLDTQKSDHRMTMLVSHVPPGAYERVANSFHMYPRYNKEYLDIIEAYSSIIGSQVFAHEHKDTFRLFFDKSGKPINVGILAPAVNPWKNTFIAPDPPNNPGIRLVSYDRDTGNILDIEQYYVDLSAANKADKAEWKQEYQFTKAMAVPDLKPSTLHTLVSNFSKSGNKLFDTFYSWNTALYSTESCNATCKTIYLCTVQHLDIASYNVCINAKTIANPITDIPDETSTTLGPKTGVPEVKTTPDSTTFSRKTTTNTPEGTNVSWKHPHRKPHHHDQIPKYFMYIMIGLGVLVFILFVVIMILCIQRRSLYPQTRYLRVPSLGIQ